VEIAGEEGGAPITVEVWDKTYTFNGRLTVEK